MGFVRSAFRKVREVNLSQESKRPVSSAGLKLAGHLCDSRSRGMSNDADAEIIVRFGRRSPDLWTNGA